MTKRSPDIRKIVDIDPFELPLAFLFPEADLAALADHRAVLEGMHVDFARGVVRLAVQSHLVRFAGATILVDTCVGEDKERPRRPDWHRRRATRFLADLAAAGCRPEDVDFVLCTHLHADHVGWNTVLDSGRWVPTFPRARYLAAAEELAFFGAAAARDPQAQHGAFADSVAPIVEAGQMQTIAPGEEVVAGASIVPLPGHTPGQVGLAVTGPDGPPLLLCGDAIHSPVQVVEPDWASAFCADPALAVTTRRALLETAADDGTLLIPAHLRGAPAMGIRRQGGGFRPMFCTCDGARLA